MIKIYTDGSCIENPGNGFFIGIMIMFTAIGSFNFQQLFVGVSNGLISGTLLTLAVVLVLVSIVVIIASFLLDLGL